ncbi:MAG: hypothetical protein U9N86_09170 [Bacteroidota bacterium]|nr:hypothetical protein [Bacteroidota bacterium]
MKLSEREKQLLKSMLAVQKRHAAMCDSIQNHVMGEKQKAWDLERVALLLKILDSCKLNENEEDKEDD